RELDLSCSSGRNGSKSRKKKRPPKRVLALPDLEQSKAAVLNTLVNPEHLQFAMDSGGAPEGIEKIRHHDPQILIVVLSGHVEILGLTEQSTGADVVLSKGPHEVQNLLRAIDRLSRRRIPSKPPGSVRTGSRAPKGKTGSGRTYSPT